MSSAFTPREIVSELDRFIVGQAHAKRAVAIALRNRWRRQQLDPGLREEVLPKNILMIGPTGVGKTEIARRLAKLAQAPFLKVEATKFTEVGYVGRDVEQIIRDLLEVALTLTRQKARETVMIKAEIQVEERLLTALVGEQAREETREKFRRQLRSGALAEREIELSVADNSPLNLPGLDLGNLGGGSANIGVGMFNLGDLLGKAMGRQKQRRLKIGEAEKLLLQEEADKLVDQDHITQSAISAVENNGIVFIDEIDKISARGQEQRGGDVSREGVQRDLLPLIEGTNVSTKYGTVRTDHILFIASGAFHLSKPSDLLPELQGRLPIRVELDALGQADLRRILTEPENSLLRQYKALMATEGVQLDFTEAAIDALAKQASVFNEQVENIGARRLHTILERVLEDLSFEASERPGTQITLDAGDVENCLTLLHQQGDLAKFIL
jgi:ATP-dependent HslUV protease ATP-binding subunit HslU